MTQNKVLARLVEGNDRFVSDLLKGNLTDAKRRKVLTKGQSPWAIVLSCADSRVVPEMAFDTGLGELFTVRVAGNVANVNSQLQIEIPTTLQEGTAKLYDGQGNLVNSYELDGLSQSLDISGTTAGSYVLKVEKDGIQVTKKVVIIE